MPTMLATILLNGFALLCLSLATIAVYLYWVGNYWKRRGVPSYGNVLIGVFQKMVRAEQCVGVCLHEMYVRTKPLKFYGTFTITQPILVVQDKEIIKQVMLKEHSSFASHATYHNKEQDPLSGHLFNLDSTDWKFMRTKLTPTFTSAKVKYMFHTIKDCASEFHKAVDEDRERLGDVVSVRELVARLTTDIISSVAFGIDSNSVESTESVFRKMGKAHFSPRWMKMFKYLLRANFKLSRLVGLRCCHDGEVDKFFMEAFSNTVKYREENNVQRHDFLDLLINLKNNRTETGNDFYDKTITMSEIAAQSFVFFMAGFETTSSALSYTFYELARHPEIQRKVHEECDKVMAACEGNVTFEVVQSMEYTDKVLHETMRIYPALPYLPRGVTKPCHLPTTDLFLEKDTVVWIPVLALHMDEDHFPSPHRFDPDRFTEDNKKNIPPYAYMPFGDGPRQCIGMRFALVQMKTVVLEFMSRYQLELPEEKLNVEFHPYTFVSAPKNDLKLKVTRR